MNVIEYMPLFNDLGAVESRPASLGPGAKMRHAFAVPDEVALGFTLDDVIAKAPLRHMVTPGGFRMSVMSPGRGEAVAASGQE